MPCWRQRFWLQRAHFGAHVFARMELRHFRPPIQLHESQKTSIALSHRMQNGGVTANREIAVFISIAILKVIMKRKSTRKSSILFCIAVCLVSVMSDAFSQTNSATQDAYVFPPHIQRLQKIGDGLSLQLQKRMEELEPRCPNVVREQMAEFSAYINKCVRPKNIPYSDENKEKQLKTCLIPIFQSYIDNADRLSRNAICAPLPDAKNCRGEQCPLPPALVAEFKRNDDLMAQLLTDALQVCPKAYAETKRTYDFKAIQCHQDNLGDRTANLRCDIAIRLKLMPELKNKTKSLCNTYLQP